MTRKEYAEGIRLIADFFEKHEDIELPHDADAFRYFSAHTKEDMGKLARALGKADKLIEDDFFLLRTMFGSLPFLAYARRDDVCERIVTGKKTIPETVIPEHVVPAHEVETVEWNCPDSLLQTPEKASAA